MYYAFQYTGVAALQVPAPLQEAAALALVPVLALVGVLVPVLVRGLVRALVLVEFLFGWKAYWDTFCGAHDGIFLPLCY